MKIIFYILLVFVILLLGVHYIKLRRIRRLTDPQRDNLRD